MPRNRPMKAVVGACLALALALSTAAAQEVLTVDAGSDLGPRALNNGFTHSRDESSPEPDPEIVQSLRPEEWRLYKYHSYQLAEKHGARITYGLCNHYAWYKGGFPNASPWLDWAEYEAYILYNMQVYDSYFPDYPVEYYDIWNEPDHSYFWHGTYTQLVELFARTYYVIKSYKPDAKVVGPSISWFRPGHSGVEGIIDLLIDLDTIHGIRLDAISWHENGGVWYDTRPDGIPDRAAALRAEIAAHFPASYQPEFHVNEYMGGQVHLSPGWNVAYFYYLPKAGVDKAMRAGWNVYSLNPTDYWNDCWYGLNGMLMKDGQTVQNAYWVNLTHALMEGEAELATTSNSKYTNIIATRNDSTRIITLLTGRHLQTSAEDVTVNVLHYGYCDTSVLVKCELIPHLAEFYDNPPLASPLPGGPLLVKEEIKSVNWEVVSFTIDDFADGEAYIVTVYPPPLPPQLTGPSGGLVGTSYDFEAVTTAPDQSDVSCLFDWGDGTNSGWIGPLPSGTAASASHAWRKSGRFTVRVKSKTASGLESDWSETKRVKIAYLDLQRW